MQFFDDLRSEHVRIDAALGALRTWASRLAAGGAPLHDRERFVAFFEIYAGRFHHEREEEVLFPALAEGAGLPVERGPVRVLLDDHSRMAGLLGELAAATEPQLIATLATRYSHELWEHMDVENSVLFVESESQLRRNGVTDLPCRELTAEESRAAGDADALVAAYPPAPPDSIRGEGCVMCHAYGDTCRGLEREWWNEWMWEELEEHVAGS